jgi:hypothetical protein
VCLIALYVGIPVCVCCCVTSRNNNRTRPVTVTTVTPSGESLFHTDVPYTQLSSYPDEQYPPHPAEN